MQSQVGTPNTSMAMHSTDMVVGKSTMQSSKQTTCGMNSVIQYDSLNSSVNDGIKFIKPKLDGN